MRSSNPAVSQLVERYMDEMDGEFSARTLARKIVDENPAMFMDDYTRDVESVRGSIRYRIGSMGKGHAKRAERSGVLRYNREQMKPSEYMARFLRKGEVTAKPPVSIRHKSTLIIGDLHIPYHTPDTISVALDYGFTHGVDAIYINGDLIDFYQISRWSRDPRRKSMSYEIDTAREFFDGLCDLGLPVYWKWGNHEDRWESFVIRQIPELMELSELQLPKLFYTDELGITVIDSKQIAKFGSLNVIHGHEFGESTFSPVNPARGIFLRAKTSTLAGHNHQTSSHHENNLNGKATACFSIGCLSNLQPEYRPYAFTKWNHGFAIVDVDGEDFHVHNKRIIDGKVR